MTSEPSCCPDKRDYFPTDTDISQEINEDNKQTSRKLQKWSESAETDNCKSPSGLCLSLDDSNNWTPQAMFEHHEKKYNFKSTYDELEYTTPLPASSDDQLLKAARIENEIIREGQHDEEDYDRTEEELFSKVVRPNKLNYYRPGKQVKRKEFERKTDKRDVHPEAVGLPEWRQTAFSKFKSTSREKDEHIDEVQAEKPTSKQIGKQKADENTEKTILKSVETVPPSPDTHTPLKEQENTSINKTELDTSANQERTPSARNKTSIQKKKDAIEYIESHSREEIKQNFISFSHDLTPRITTIAKTPQDQENTNSIADLTSNSYSNLDIFTAPVSKSVPNLESNSNENTRSQATTTNPAMYSVVTRESSQSAIEVSENWELETTDTCSQSQIRYEQTCSEHSSVQSQLTPQHSHTLSHDSQDSGVLDSEYPPSTESDTNNITSESENCKQQQQQQQQQGSTLNPQAEEFRFDMSKLSDSILSDPGYLRSLRKGTSQKYSKQPNASMRGRGNSGTVPSQRGDRLVSGIGYNKKQDMTSPGGVGGKPKGYTDSIVGPTGQVLPKRGSRKGSRYKVGKYKPTYEMEQQLYTVPGSQFQVLSGPNNLYYQAKTGPIPQQMQLSTHPTAPPHHSLQAIQSMHNPQLAMQQVSYPGFALPTQMPEDPQSIVAHQSTQILIGPDGMPITYLPPTQTDYQHYTTQNPHIYPQIPPSDTPQYIIPQYMPTNQHGYPMQIDTQQPNQIIYPTYHGQHHQANIIQLQGNTKANMY